MQKDTMITIIEEKLDILAPKIIAAQNTLKEKKTTLKKIKKQIEDNKGDFKTLSGKRTRLEKYIEDDEPKRLEVIRDKFIGQKIKFKKSAEAYLPETGDQETAKKEMKTLCDNATKELEELFHEVDNPPPSYSQNASSESGENTGDKSHAKKESEK